MNSVIPSYVSGPAAMTVPRDNGLAAKRRYSWLITLCLAGYLFIFTDNLAIDNAIMLLSAFCFLQLVFSIGKIIPVREMTVLLMVVQLLLMPYLDYELLLPRKMSAMVIDKEIYFDYAFPAVLAFYIGMNIRLRKSQFSFRHHLTQAVSAEEKKIYEKIGFTLVAIGVFFSLLNEITTIPGFEFVAIVLRLFRFVGIFYLAFSGSKYTWVVLIGILVWATIDTIRSSVFIDLLVWLFFIYAFLAIKYKIRAWFSIMLILLVTTFMIILQSAKMQYRQVAWRESLVEQDKEGVSLFGDILSTNLQEMNTRKFTAMQNAMINRMNQGWIVSFIMRKDPAGNVVERKYYIYNEIMGIFLPRIVFPDKPVVGDHEKFRYLTGFPLARTVAMNVGILGDGYGNFGFAGGIFFCLLFGLLLNMGITWFLKVATNIKTLVFWMPLIFFYVMRAGNEFYIIANWTVKVAIIIALYYWISRQVFRKYY